MSQQNLRALLGEKKSTTKLTKITEVGQFTPRAWAKAKAKEKLIALAA